MDERRVTYAVRQGLTIATAVAAVLWGLSFLRQQSPSWPAVLPVALAFGLGYLSLVYFEVGPIDPYRGTN